MMQILNYKNIAFETLCWLSVHYLAKVQCFCQLLKRTLDIAANLKDMSSTDAKLTFIQAWQRLPEAGQAYFIVTFKGSPKKVLILCINRRKSSPHVTFWCNLKPSRDVQLMSRCVLYVFLKLKIN